MASAALDWLKWKEKEKQKKIHYYSTCDSLNVQIGEKREGDAIYIGSMRMLPVI